MFQEVILAIGTTGLGKSFTATLFGFNAVVGHTSNSTTKVVKIYRNEKYVFIDTPGFDDTDVKVEDKVTNINILSKLQEENITELHTVFWFVHYDSKAKQSLQKEAEFIETLARSKTNNIWNNVIVVYKGIGENFDKTVIKDVIKKVNVSLDLAKTHLMAVKLYNSQEELLGIYKNIMQEKHHAENPVRIVFGDDMCVKCGIKGDRRLVRNSPCHTKEKQRHDKDENDNDLIEEYKVHTGRYRHTGSFITVQDQGWKIADDIVGAIPVVNLFKFIPEIGIAATQRQKWSCCGGNLRSEGCESITSSKRRHTCCREDVGAPGCNKFCASCGGAWGNSKGCSYHEEHKYLD